MQHHCQRFVVLGHSVAHQKLGLAVLAQVSYDGQLEHFDEDDVDIMQLFASFVGPKLTLGIQSCKWNAPCFERWL